MRVLRRPIHAGLVLLALAAMLLAGCGHRAARVNAPLAPARIGSTETGVASWYGIPYDGRRAASGEVYDMRQLTAAHRSLPFQTWVEVTNLSNGKQVDVRINDRGPFVKGRIVDLSQAAARDIDMLRAGTTRVRLKVIPTPSTASNIPPRTPPREQPRELPQEPSPERVEITAAPTIVPAPTPTIEPPIAHAAPVVTSPPSDTITSPVPAPNVDERPPSPASSATATRAPGYAVQAGAFSDPARAESLRATLAQHFANARVAASSGSTPPLWRVIVGRDMTREQAAQLAARIRREAGNAIVVQQPESTP